MEFKKVAIIGVGLIGGSLGMGLIARRLARQVTGIGRNESNLRKAVTMGAVTDYTTEARDGVKDAELVVLALPVGLITGTLKTILPHLSPGTVVTDVGSTKARIVAEAEELVPGDIHFIGGHPMTGSEREGVAAADHYLFEGAYYILTPTPRTHPAALAVMSAMIEGLGARVIQLDPGEHDRTVAAISHLPHLAACSIMNTVAGLPEGERMLTLAAGGFRDTTRIAAGSPEVWRDIFLSNRDFLLDMVVHYRVELERIERILSENDAAALSEWLRNARHARNKLPAQAKGYLRDLYELQITVSDRPGSIASVAGILYHQGLNIADIEVLRVREGEAGAVRIAFRTEAERDRAFRELRREGLTVRKSRED